MLFVFMVAVDLCSFLYN